MSQIERLTPQQEALIPVYRDRWRSLTLSTTPIDASKAEAAIKAAYTAIDKQTPQVLLFKGPVEAKENLRQKTPIQILQEFGIPLFPFPLAAYLTQELRTQLSPELLKQLNEQFPNERLNGFSFRLYTAIWSPLSEILPQNETIHIDGQTWGMLSEQMLRQYWQQQQIEWRQELLRQPGGDWLIQIGETLGQWGQPLGQLIEDNVLQPLKEQAFIQTWSQGLQQLLGFFSMIGLGWNTLRNTVEEFPLSLLDFCISVLGCRHDEKQWQALRSLVIEGGSLLTFEKACLMLDRPLRLSIDEEERLHAEGVPALQFTDGYQAYFFRNVQLPESYGKLLPQQWHSEWLLTEPNAELRRVFIQGIGYARICQELQATEINSWREYTLLRIDSNIDVESIYLIKMTCPSTGYIHATRVPPEMRSAREAIRWVNWETDPEEFGIES